MIVVRAETVEDHSAVRGVNESAFGRSDEADLVEALRENARPRISLVAEENGRIVGHIFFSPVSIEPADPGLTALGLAPMAVLPAYQKKGVGSRLVREGLEESHRLGFDAVIVIGHPEYYPRFGFRPAKEEGLRCEYEVPDEAFMVVGLKEGALTGRGGMVKYRPEFSRV